MKATSTFRRILKKLIIASALLATSAAANAGLVARTNSAPTVTLTWDHSPTNGATIIGYRMYYGAATATYTNVMQVGYTNVVTVTGLVPGTRFFFAVTAVADDGQESPYSNEAQVVTRPQPLAPNNNRERSAQYWQIGSGQ